MPAKIHLGSKGFLVLGKGILSRMLPHSIAGSQNLQLRKLKRHRNAIVPLESPDLLSSKESPRPLPSLHSQSAAGFDALVATGLEFAAHFRSGFVDATKLVFLEKGAGFQERQRIQLVGDPIRFGKFFDLDSFFFDFRLLSRIFLGSEYREAAATGPAIHTIVVPN